MTLEHTSKYDPGYFVIAAFLIILAIGAAFLDYFTPYMGDDLAFWNTLGLENYRFPNRATLSFIAGHFEGCNGRFFDFIGPVIVDLMPRGVGAMVMGAMSGFLFFSLLYASRIPIKGHTAMLVVFLTVALGVFPWWDSMFMRVCQFNYSWGTAFCLVFIGLFFSGRNFSGKGICVLMALSGFLAGSNHEQTTVAVGGAFFIWLIVSRHYKSISWIQKIMLVSFCIGALFPLLSPGIWLRAGGPMIRQDFLLLLITTFPVFLLMFVVLALCSLSLRGREYVRRALADDGFGMVLILSGVFSAVIALACGVPGRTGFLSEACALIVLLRLCYFMRWRISRLVGLFLIAGCFALVSAHFIVSVKQQHAMWYEHCLFLEQYKNSPDGFVFGDFTDRYDVSPLTLNRVKGVSDADDIWNNVVYARTYRSDGRVPIVLPEVFKELLPLLSDSVSAEGSTVFTFSPAGIVETVDGIVMLDYPDPAPRVITHTTMESGREVWIATPRVRDPGDYNLPIVQKP